MTPDEIQRLRDLAARATPGPWGEEYHETGANLTYCPHGDDCINSRHDPYLAQDLSQADADYLAALSPEVVLRLLDELAAYRSTERLRDAVNKLLSGDDDV